MGQAPFGQLTKMSTASGEEKPIGSGGKSREQFQITIQNATWILICRQNGKVQHFLEKWLEIVIWRNLS